MLKRVCIQVVGKSRCRKCKCFISLLKQRVFDLFVQNWNTDINNSTRARCYILYSNFRFQPYLNLIKTERFRVASSHFKVSAHMLDVETGRWHKPVAVPLNERKCWTRINYLEDEFCLNVLCKMNSETQLIAYANIY